MPEMNDPFYTTPEFLGVGYEKMICSYLYERE